MKRKRKRKRERKKKGRKERKREEEDKKKIENSLLPCVCVFSIFFFFPVWVFFLGTPHTNIHCTLC